MFVHPESRGKNIASQILEELESWAKELSFTLYFRNGQKIPEAIGLYKKNG
jgi:GNAT superfamily N-acetyltransferase